MHKPQDQVLEFHCAFEQPAPSMATLEEFRPELRARLVLEEALEFAEACGLEVVTKDEDGCDVPVRPKTFIVRQPTLTVLMKPPNWPEMIDALCDVLYVTYGSFVEMGVNAEPFYDEVHRSNMAKVGGETRSDGKRLKPPGWTKPDIKGLLTKLLGVIK
jgi:predicted HAD superfamily Cof-like phosphohydrolase